MDERVELSRLVAVWLGFFMISSIILVCLWGIECRKSVVLEAKYNAALEFIRQEMPEEQEQELMKTITAIIEQNARTKK